MEFWLLLFSFAAIVLCNTIEAYAYVIKGFILQLNARTTIGLASWIQYCARILYVFVLLFLSALYEFFDFRTELLNVIFYATLVSTLTVCCVILNERFRDIIRFFIFPLVKLSYPALADEKFSIKHSPFRLSYPVFFISTLSSLMLGIALVLPFVVAIRFPEYRMMATYIGQFVNFFATAVTFSYLEPKLFNELDRFSETQEGLSNIGKNIVYSKIAAVIVLCFITFTLTV